MKSNLSIIITLCVFVIIATVSALLFINEKQLSSYGSIISAGGSLLAVILFSANLMQQTKQIKEQNTQFLQEFKHLREDGRRNALIMCKDILDTTERQILSTNQKFNNLSELVTEYLNFAELKTICESDNPNNVKKYLKSWNQKEAAANILMTGIKNAAQIYFVAIGKENIDYSKSPEEFVSQYGKQLWSIPFFERFQNPSMMLADFMVGLQPGREAATIAALATAVILGGKENMRVDLIREKIKKHVERGYAIPKIAENL
jgi:hypothetical protein